MRFYILLICIVSTFSCNPGHPEKLIETQNANNAGLPLKISHELTVLKVKLEEKSYIYKIEVSGNYEYKYKKLNSSQIVSENIVFDISEGKENFLMNIFDFGYNIKFDFLSPDGAYLNSLILTKDNFLKFKYKMNNRVKNSSIEESKLPRRQSE